MLRLNEGRSEEAWGDLLTCHRLARLAGQGPTVVEAFDAFSIEETACAGDQALLQHAHLNVPQISKMREDLDRLSPMPKMADKLNIAERFTYLNVASDYSRHGSVSMAGFDCLPEFEDLKNTIKSLGARIAPARRLIRTSSFARATHGMTGLPLPIASPPEPSRKKR